MKKILALVLSVVLAAGVALPVMAVSENMKTETPWKTVKALAPDDLADMFGKNYPQSEKTWGKAESGKLLTGTVVTGVSAENGTTHCWVDGADNASKAFDGDIKTFFDPYEASTNSWCGLLLDQAYELTEVRICNREEQPDRIIGGAIQGSNDNGVTWTTVVYVDPKIYGDTALLENDYHVITPNFVQKYVNMNKAKIKEGSQIDFSAFWVGSGSFSMYRYVNLNGTHGDCAEIELYGNPHQAYAGETKFKTSQSNSLEKFYDSIHVFSTHAVSVNGSITGKVISGGGLWAEGINGSADAWDGRGETFYDPQSPTPDCWTGLLADQPTIVTEVKVMPRIGFFDRTNGAFIQGSNDGKTWTTLAKFTEEDCLKTDAQSYIVKKVTNTNAFWMFRYVNDGTSHGDVADLAIYGTKGEAILTFPGQVIGQVLSTDIRAYINGAEIPAYNVDGKLAVLVSDLNNYGFKTQYNNDLRKTTVTRNKGAKDFESVPSKASGKLIGTPVMSVYSTDIVVELDGNQVQAFNVDNRMAIPFSALKAYGQYAYDNTARTSSVTLAD